jgi:hypothetical protein
VPVRGGLKDAIVRHGMLPISGGSATELSATDAWRRACR